MATQFRRSGCTLALAILALLALGACPPAPRFSLSYSVTPVATGSVTREPDETLYGKGEAVTLTAIPQQGWVFDHWEGDLSGSSNPATLTMDGDKDVTAVFVVALQVPASFTQKVLIEEVTGTWCGFCPDGAYRMQQLVDQYPGRVFGAAYHTGDSLAVAGYAEWASGLGGVSGVPMGAVNRTENGGSVIVNRGYWSSMTTSALAQGAPCGLRIVSSLSGSAATVDVSVGFSAAVTGELRLTVVLTEDEITGFPQANYYDTVSTSPFYLMGNPIEDYVHRHVLRAFLTPVLGDPVAAADATPGGEAAFQYTTTVPATWVTGRVAVVALVHGWGTDAASKRVLNVQSVALGNTQEWD